ncbi:hypothetical protein BV22DRAFT_163358 [Leucogyrophana mollusca]|uniref:Uncharacterized protein n=1 Tax=Leucogyrophana mollusca TaxID=85980 RepID=A0ACB8BSJ4_9AGAM|nr:hypothetical protein BV22DRAFT_163358 [Leucogyrophana mollusca]
MSHYDKGIKGRLCLCSKARVQGSFPTHRRLIAMLAVQSPVNALRKVEPKLLPQGAHLWKIDIKQSNRLSTLLDVDFSTFDVKGHALTTPEYVCHGCGKLSGLDDFVGTGLKLGVHTKKFMINALTHPHRNTSTPHELECCVCGTVYLDRYRVDKADGKALRKKMADSGYDPVHDVGAGVAHELMETLEKAQETAPQTLKDAPAVIGWATGSSFDWVYSAKDVTAIEKAQGSAQSEDTPAVIGWATGWDFDWVYSAKDVAAVENVKETAPQAVSNIQSKRARLKVLCSAAMLPP